MHPVNKFSQGVLLLEKGERHDRKKMYWHLIWVQAVEEGCWHLLTEKDQFKRDSSFPS